MLDPDLRNKIKNELKEGNSYRKIAKLNNVSSSEVQVINNEMLEEETKRLSEKRQFLINDNNIKADTRQKLENECSSLSNDKTRMEKETIEIRQEYGKCNQLRDYIENQKRESEYWNTTVISQMAYSRQLDFDNAQKEAYNNKKSQEKKNLELECTGLMEIKDDWEKKVCELQNEAKFYLALTSKQAEAAQRNRATLDNQELERIFLSYMK